MINKEKQQKEEIQENPIKSNVPKISNKKQDHKMRNKTK